MRKRSFEMKVSLAAGGKVTRLELSFLVKPVKCRCGSSTARSLILEYFEYESECCNN